MQGYHLCFLDICRTNASISNDLCRKILFLFVKSTLQSILVNYFVMPEFTKPSLSYAQALVKASDLCSQSEKCSLDIELKCREWQLSREESSKLLDYLRQEKFIDHQRYAKSFVSDKFRFNKWGKIKLAFALRQKQVEEIWIREALSHLQEELYHEVLKDLLLAKAKTLKEKDPYSRRGKLLAFAQSRGFGAEEALRLIGEL